MVDDVLLQSEYDRIMEYCQKEKMNSDVITQSTEFQKGKWRDYRYLLDRIPLSLEDKIFADLGCKYGLLFPLLFQYKVKKAIGIEGLEEFIQVAKRIFSVARGYERVEFALCKEGYLPLQPETVDIVFACEVISHVNPSFLPTLFFEVGRILRVGGILFVSDGNNLSCPGYFEDKLLPWYHALENGPDGTQVGNFTVQRCFINQRKDIIIRRHPDTPEALVELLAKNTCGLWGAWLENVIDHFVLTGELIRRPYRRGIAPTYPSLGWAGMVEERGFYPERIMLELMECGFEATLLDMPVRTSSVGKRAILENERMKLAAWYQGKNAYISPLPETFPGSKAGCSTLVLENDKPLAMPNAIHVDIADKGTGRYSVWHDYILLSTSDNTDPRSNGRCYELYWVKQGEDRLVFGNPNFQICAVKKGVRAPTARET
jgi:SAM-dependent methyltransferase